MAVHKSAKFTRDLKASHDAALKRIRNCFLSSLDKGSTYEPDISKGLNAFVDTDFASRFDKVNVKNLVLTYSRTRHVIKHAGYLIIWKSTLQTEIALSTTKVECAALSIALRETILIMHFFREVSAVMNVADCSKTMKCTVFEDNNGTLEIAKTLKMRPRTKHISIKHNIIQQQRTRSSLCTD